jgi:hypothetical protein
VDDKDVSDDPAVRALTPIAIQFLLPESVQGRLFVYCK